MLPSCRSQHQRSQANQCRPKITRCVRMNDVLGWIFGQVLEKLEDGESKPNHGQRSSYPCHQCPIRGEHRSVEGQFGPFLGQGCPLVLGRCFGRIHLTSLRKGAHMSCITPPYSTKPSGRIFFMETRIAERLRISSLWNKEGATTVTSNRQPQNLIQSRSPEKSLSFSSPYQFRRISRLRRAGPPATSSHRFARSMCWHSVESLSCSRRSRWNALRGRSRDSRQWNSSFHTWRDTFRRYSLPQIVEENLWDKAGIQGQRREWGQATTRTWKLQPVGHRRRLLGLRH